MSRPNLKYYGYPTTEFRMFCLPTDTNIGWLVEWDHVGR